MPQTKYFYFFLQISRQSIDYPFEVKKLKSEKEKMDESEAKRSEAKRSEAKQSEANNYPQRFVFFLLCFKLNSISCEDRITFLICKFFMTLFLKNNFANNQCCNFKFYGMQFNLF